MAAAFKCDRCGDLQEGEPVMRATESHDPIAELCNRCKREFLRWWENVNRPAEARPSE